jgi:tryptophan-rich sensory protein
MNFFLAYFISAIVVITTSVSSQYFTFQSVKSEWYKCVESKIRITPPAYVFPIVWTTLYVLIWIAFARALIPPGKENHLLISLFLVNLLFNILWCYVYFGLRKLALAIPVLFMILATAVGILFISFDLDFGFSKGKSGKLGKGRNSGDKVIGILLIPYIAWLTFALISNVLSLRKTNQDQKC